MTDIQPGQIVLIPARVSLVIEHQGRQRVRLDDIPDWVDAEECVVIREEEQ